MSRNLAIFALIQILLVVLGFFGLGVVMKWNGYPDELFGIHWTMLALLLRRYGLILLLVPVIWSGFSGLSQSRGRLLVSLDAWLVLGIIFSVLIICLFLYAAVNPYYRTMFIGH